MQCDELPQSRRAHPSYSAVFRFFCVGLLPAFSLAFCAGCNPIDELDERQQEQIENEFQTPPPMMSPTDPDSESQYQRTVIFPGSKVALDEVWTWDVDDQEWWREGAKFAEIPKPGLGGGARGAAMSGSGGGTGQTRALPAMALFAGGVGERGVNATAQAYFYDFLSDAWTGLTMSAPRTGHTLTTLLDNRVLVVGGWAGDLQQFIPQASAELFDPRTKTFTATGSLHTRRMNHAATLLADGRVLITGGSLEEEPFEPDTAEIYDPVSGTFTVATGRMTRIRSNHTATTLDDGRVLIVGSNSGKSAEAYDPATDTFSPVGDLTTTHGTGLTATKLPSGKVLILGGFGDQQRGDPTTAVAELFDPATNTFTAIGSMNVARRTHAAIPQGDGRVLICGGITDQGDTVASCELFDPATNTFIPAANLPRPASEHAGIFLEKAP